MSESDEFDYGVNITDKFAGYHNSHIYLSPENLDGYSNQDASIFRYSDLINITPYGC